MCEFCEKYSVRYDTFTKKWLVEARGHVVATTGYSEMAYKIANSLNLDRDATYVIYDMHDNQYVWNDVYGWVDDLEGALVLTAEELKTFKMPENSIARIVS